jgi:O-antigen/teichoic acid export membrane protein
MLKVLKRKTNSIIIETLSSQMLELIVSFIKNVVIIRYVGVGVFGQYQFLVALFVFIDFGVSALDGVLRRFYGEGSAAERSEILFANIALKLLIYLLGCLGVFGYVAANHQIAVDREILLFLAAYFLCNSVFTTVSSLAQGLKMFRTINQSNAILSIGTLLVFLFAYFLGGLAPREFLFFYLYLNAAAVICKLSYLLWSLGLEPFLNFRSLKLDRVFETGLWRHRSYLYPQIVGNLSGYIINFLPVLLLGHKAQFDQISYLEVIKKIFKYIHKIIPTAVKGMIPTVVDKAKEKQFPKKWGGYTFTYMAFALFLGMTLYVFAEPIMGVYKIPFEEVINQLFIVYAFYLVWGAWAQSMDFLVLSGRSTLPMSINYFGRQLFAVGGYILIFDQLSPVSLAVVAVSSILISVAIYVVWIYRYKKEFLVIQGWAFGIAFSQAIIMLLMYYTDSRLKMNVSLDIFKIWN